MSTESQATPHCPQGSTRRHPVGRPGVVENVPAGLVARDAVGNDCVIRTLVVGDGAAKIALRELVLDNTLASPARRTARRTGVAITVEHTRHPRIPEVAKIGDTRIIGCLVHTIALKRTSISSPTLSSTASPPDSSKNPW